MGVSLSSELRYWAGVVCGPSGDDIAGPMLDAADRLDMRAVVIVEFWAMMAGALPYGWEISVSGHRAWGPGVMTPCLHGGFRAPETSRLAWLAEYAARPRL